MGDNSDSGKSYSTILFVIDVILFVGWCILTIRTIKSPLLLSWDLFGWWLVIAVALFVLCCGKEDDELKTGILSTELVCLIICNCILSFVNNQLFFISLAIGLVFLIAVPFVMGDDSDSEKCLFVIDMILFVGWCVLTVCTIKSPPLLSWVLLGWWFVITVVLFVLCCDREMDSGWKTGIISTELVCLFICPCILSFMNDELFYIRLGAGLVCLVAGSVLIGRKKETREPYSIILFVIDMILFVGWCILIICTIKSPPLLSWELFGWWIVIGVVLVGLGCVGYVDGGWRVGILSGELMCLILCTCILSFINYWSVFIRLGVGLVCFVAGSVLMGREKVTKKPYTIILFVIDILIFFGWCILAIRTIKSPSLLSWELLGWWLVIAVALFVLCCGEEDGGLKAGIISTELVCVFICPCILSFMNDELFYIRLGAGLVCLVAGSVLMGREKETKKPYTIILFVIDMILFVGWSILVIRTIKSPSLLSWELLGWWFVIGVVLVELCCFGCVDGGLRVGILSVELVGLILCSCILSFVNKWLFFISLGIGVVYVILIVCALNDLPDEGGYLLAIWVGISACLVTSALISYFSIVKYPLLFWGLLSWCIIMVFFWILCCIFV